MIDYYARVADAILPHLRGRPLTLKRFPEGVEPASLLREELPQAPPRVGEDDADLCRSARGKIDFCMCENLATLTWMAQLAALELHPSLSKATRMEQPTVLAFDLDPGAAREPRPVLPGGPAGSQALCGSRPRGLPEGLGRQRPSGLHPPEHQGQLRADQPVREGGRPAPRAGDAQGGRLEDGEGPAAGQGLRRLEPEPPEEDDDRRLLASSPRAADGLDSAPLEGSRASRQARDADNLRFEIPAAIKRVEKESDLFEPVLKLRQKLPKLTAISED